MTSQLHLEGHIHRQGHYLMIRCRPRRNKMAEPKTKRV